MHLSSHSFLLGSTCPFPLQETKVNVHAPINLILEFLKEAFSKVAISTIPLDAFHLCFVRAGSFLTTTQISLSLAFGKHVAVFSSRSLYFFGPNSPSGPIDFVIFVIVVARTQIIKSENHGINISSIISKISQDTEIYFVVISSSHFLAVIMSSVARVGFASPMLELNTWLTAF